MPLPDASAIFFDAGGTLLRPARPVGETYAEIAAHYGAALDAGRVQREFKNAFAHLQDRTGFPVPTDGEDKAWWREVVRLSLAKEDVPERFPFDDCFEEVYAAFARPGLWRVFPEVEAVLATLRDAGRRLYVLSNWDARLRDTLRGLDLLPYFEAVVISSEQGVAKPDPAIYRRALEIAGLEQEETSAPSSSPALMVGDDEENDYWAPRRAGWQALVIDRRAGEDLTKML